MENKIVVYVSNKFSDQLAIKVSKGGVLNNHECYIKWDASTEKVEKSVPLLSGVLSRLGLKLEEIIEY